MRGFIYIVVLLFFLALVFFNNQKIAIWGVCD